MESYESVKELMEGSVLQHIKNELWQKKYETHTSHVGRPYFFL